LYLDAISAGNNMSTPWSGLCFRSVSGFLRLGDTCAFRSVMQASDNSGLLASSVHGGEQSNHEAGDWRK